MRSTKLYNEGWSFVKEGLTTIVDLPHTWNNVDGQDGGNDYYRGACTYTKTVDANDLGGYSSYFLEVRGANSSASISLNGVKLVDHDGGYSTFRAALGALQGGEVISIQVDNSPNDRVYPQMADFTFYGGLYRNVYLIGVNDDHFDLMDNGSSALYVTPFVEPAAEGRPAFARVCLKSKVSSSHEAKVVYRILDADGAEVVKAEAPAKAAEAAAEVILENVHLWNGLQDPYLYSCTADLVIDGETVDSVSARFGCRFFEIDPDKGFILNGKPYPLRGVSRHQDRLGIGNALLPDHHKEDIELILEVGANTIRLAHYQHDQYFYDLCDEKGLIIWAEIPFISQYLPEGDACTRSMMKELVLQNYNHASIAVWGLSNEITLGGDDNKALIENHQILNDLCHSLDPIRKTTLAAVTMCNPSARYLSIPDVISYNHYFGWYGGTTDMNGPWLDKFHKEHPLTPIGLSEYGCEGLNWHTSNPTQGDYTEEYQAYYHEELIKQLDARPYLWATHVWNMFDFGADARAEGGENGQNHKGLVTFDRQYKKDAFYAYKAWLSKEPFVHICGKRYVNRVEEETLVKVYSNLNEVELFCNGTSLGKKQGKWFFEFTVPNQGESTLLAVSGECRDESCIRKVDEFDESYVLKETGAVLNWFDVTAPEGRFSLLDTVSDVIKHPLGLIAVLSSLKKILVRNGEDGADKKKKDGKKKGPRPSLGGGMGSSLLKMLSGFTLMRMINLVATAGGQKVSKDEVLKLNKKLNKIRKPRKKN